jgi:DNA-binding NtrC family response regulator
MPAILVVDDEPMLRAMIEFALRLEGFPVMTAGSAAEALSAAHSNPGDVDLLITEVRLPGMNGPDLAANLLAEDPAMRVLFLAGSLDAAPPLGPSPQFEVFAKPFPLNAFLAEVRKLMQPLPVPSLH